MRGHNRPPFRPKLPGTDMTSADAPTAIIYRPSRSPVQSGPRPRHWILEFEPAAPSEIEPLMGWTATRDPYRPIRLSFPDCESAIKYAERNDWNYVIRGEGKSKPRMSLEPKSRPHESLDEPQPRGRVEARMNHAESGDIDPVELASLASFPASDPPVWTGTTLAAR